MCRHRPAVVCCIRFHGDAALTETRACTTDCRDPNDESLPVPHHGAASRFQRPIQHECRHRRIHRTADHFTRTTAEKMRPVEGIPMSWECESSESLRPRADDSTQALFLLYFRPPNGHGYNPSWKLNPQRQVDAETPCCAICFGIVCSLNSKPRLTSSSVPKRLYKKVCVTF